MKPADYLLLPWSIVRTEHDDGDGPYIALYVRELPGFVVAGATDAEVEAEFWPTLEAFIASYLEDGQEPPRPAPRVLPAKRKPRGVYRYRSGAELLESMGPLSDPTTILEPAGC